MFQIKCKTQRLYSRLPLITCFIFDKTTAEKKLARFNDILKLRAEAQGECKQYLEEEQIKNCDNWHDEVDERVFNSNMKIYSRLKETNGDDRCSEDL